MGFSDSDSSKEEAVVLLAETIHLAGKWPSQGDHLKGKMMHLRGALIHASLEGEAAEVDQILCKLGNTPPTCVIKDLRDIWDRVDKGEPLNTAPSTTALSSGAVGVLLEARSHALAVLTKSDMVDRTPDHLGCLGVAADLLAQRGLQATAFLVTEHIGGILGKGVSLDHTDVEWVTSFLRLLEDNPDLDVLEGVATSIDPYSFVSPIPHDIMPPRMGYAPDVILDGDDTGTAAWLVRKNLSDYGTLYLRKDRVPYGLDDRLALLWPSNVGLVRSMDARAFPLIRSADGQPVSTDLPVYLPANSIRLGRDKKMMAAAHYKNSRVSALTERTTVTEVRGRIDYATKSRLRKRPLARWVSDKGEAYIREWVSIYRRGYE